MKNIQKSVRISQDIYEMICLAPGKNFNDKFSNIIEFCNNDNKDLKAERDRLLKEIRTLEKKVDDLHSIVDRLENIQNYVNFAYDYVCGK